MERSNDGVLIPFVACLIGSVDIVQASQWHWMMMVIPQRGVMTIDCTTTFHFNVLTSIQSLLRRSLANGGRLHGRLANGHVEHCTEWNNDQISIAFYILNMMNLSVDCREYNLATVMVR